MTRRTLKMKEMVNCAEMPLAEQTWYFATICFHARDAYSTFFFLSSAFPLFCDWARLFADCNRQTLIHYSCCNSLTQHLIKTNVIYSNRRFWPNYVKFGQIRLALTKFFVCMSRLGRFQHQCNACRLSTAKRDNSCLDMSMQCIHICTMTLHDHILCSFILSCWSTFKPTLSSLTQNCRKRTIV